ncbi:cobyric acid synthase [Listeria seeligeri]|uniref:cobyric acid synthase n=1 Tax=Listeria seeligeri TaxID=1640 RepID=UPI001625E2AB|nr:cobyric acid synthase [Listeria seeligeri]MBC1824119.1 cobyric acid synthase [Listeria seeligeri]MBC1837947.1 cobyric acid synthase [Listeria seeligeri]MBF2360528.1 cobyric acid synthase [Listeria seeligeri]MBF2497716.1 cobyric acid synthase [Listeria seeligeri]MBF2541854.1 cobyric acid synthase [Listeria seeligeri]
MVQQIMIQGTASDAGKSVLVAGLCRLFKNKGFRVVPFKSQNMSLNSFITATGDEMGRAQVFQAEAAGVFPDVRMNPVLLKPTNDRQSQVIFMGSILANMDAVSYHDFKQTLIPKIQAVYQSLAAENDIIVLEGAGSPAEINLNDRDIVNMGMAKMVDAPVVLVADIDKGGVFASIYGTIMLLKDEERTRLKGVIINKFRGDVALLQPGIEMIEALTNVPVIGVIPYANLQLEEEDSVALSGKKTTADDNALLDIAVVCLPRISNFTDFHVLEIQPDISVRYIRSTNDFGNPDLLIIPGSKNTIADMTFLEESGLKKAIQHFAEKNGKIIGICGGYQILGEKMLDPNQVESSQLEIAGLGLLHTETTFQDQKQTTQISGVTLSGEQVEGYEIHMGKTTRSKNTQPFCEIQAVNGNSEIHQDGAVSASKNIIGTYIHGVFDNPTFLKNLFHELLMKKQQMTYPHEITPLKEHKEQEYNKLATLLEENIQMDKLEKIMKGEKICVSTPKPAIKE